MVRQAKYAPNQRIWRLAAGGTKRARRECCAIGRLPIYSLPPATRGNAMSLDRSLKGSNALIRHRNVLTRTERLAQLTDEERWNDSKSVFGLPKVANRKQ